MTTSKRPNAIWTLWPFHTDCNPAISAKGIVAYPFTADALLFTIFFTYAFLIICLLLFPPSTLSADSWEHLITEHFYFHYQPVDRRIAQQLSEKSDAVYQKISRDVGDAPPRKIAVYLCPDTACFERQQPHSRKAPEWAVGLAYPQLNRIVMRSAVKPNEGGRIKPFEVFTHELAHIILEQALVERGGAPRWLSEGFSMYYARQWTVHGQRTLEEVTLGEQFIPLSILTTNFPSDERTARIAYAQSFSVVTFLLHDYDRIFFQRFIEALTRGLDTDRALHESFGMTVQQLERRWQASQKRRYSWFGYLSHSGLFWFLPSVLFLLAYLLKRRQAKRLQQAWEEEEQEESIDAETK